MIICIYLYTRISILDSDPYILQTSVPRITYIYIYTDVVFPKCHHRSGLQPTKYHHGGVIHSSVISPNRYCGSICSEPKFLVFQFLIASTWCCLSLMIRLSYPKSIALRYFPNCMNESLFPNYLLLPGLTLLTS